MSILNCYVDERTLRTLEKVSIQTGRTITDLAEAAISEAAVQADVSERFANQNPAEGIEP